MYVAGVKGSAVFNLLRIECAGLAALSANLEYLQN